MKNSLFLILIFSASSFAAVPDPIVTGTDSYNGYATVSGRLNAKPDHPVGISIRNGNTLSSTLTDADGRWSIVFRHRSVQYTVAAWDLATPSDRSEASGELAIAEENR